MHVHRIAFRLYIDSTSLCQSQDWSKVLRKLQLQIGNCPILAARNLPIDDMILCEAVKLPVLVHFWLILIQDIKIQVVIGPTLANDWWWQPDKMAIDHRFLGQEKWDCHTNKSTASFESNGAIQLSSTSRLYRGGVTNGIVTCTGVTGNPSVAFAQAIRCHWYHAFKSTIRLVKCFLPKRQDCPSLCKWNVESFTLCELWEDIFQPMQTCTWSSKFVLKFCTSVGYYFASLNQDPLYRNVFFQSSDAAWAAMDVLKRCTLLYMGPLLSLIMLHGTSFVEKVLDFWWNIIHSQPLLVRLWHN